MPMINILTRTSNRPIGFHTTRNSILSQTYKNFRHIVCTDDTKSRQYIKSSGIDDYIFVDTNRMPPSRDSSGIPDNEPPAPHNLYMNELMSSVTDGWIIYLDDDDSFTHKRVLQEIAAVITDHDQDTVIYWRMVYPNGQVRPKVIAPDYPPERGKIGSPCFTFHSKHRDHAVWDGWKCSDFRVIKRLHNQIPHKVWIPKSYVFVPQSGLGRRNDIKLTPVLKLLRYILGRLR